MSERLLILVVIIASAVIVGAIVNALLRRRHKIDRIDAADIGAAARVVVFTSPYCHGCKQWLEALEADSINARAIDVAERPDAAARYRISSTPRVLVTRADGTVVGDFHHFEPRRSDLDRILSLIQPMDAIEAIRSRRTWKSYSGDPLTREELDELFEIARWAPNHKLTQPWRFRVVGPVARERLRAATAETARQAAPEGADVDTVVAVALKKLEMAPTIVAVTSLRNPDPALDVEDFSSSSVATYILMLAAHSKGFATFWRSPGVLQSAAGSAALGIDAGEEALGFVYLGRPGDVPPKPAQREDAAHFVTYLD